MMLRKYSLAAFALILGAGSASANLSCTISDGVNTGMVMSNDWVAFYEESENAGIPGEYLITKEWIFRDPTWRNKLKTVTAPEGCESVVWTGFVA